nr:MAG TPA: hypothetical protein [Caudoviricetes sp.]
MLKFTLFDPKINSIHFTCNLSSYALKSNFTTKNSKILS